MNKFNKKLTISLPQDPLYTHQNQSPSVPQSMSHDKQGLLQFRQFRDGADSQFGDLRNDNQNSKLNFVEFEEFHVNRYQPKEKLKTDEEKKSPKNKKNFMIDVPDRDQQRADERKFKGSKLNDNYMINYEDDRFKQPPAPSKGSKQNKVFIFPATPNKKQQKDKGKQKDNHKDKEMSQTKQELKKSFQRERQEFYKQKSRLQKQLMIKNGQIQMLHNLLTQHLSSPNQRQQKISQQYQSIHHQQFQTIILQKDLQISQLLQKISDLNNYMSRKNQQNNKKIIELNAMQSLVESLKNQLYIYERKDQSDKLTKKFYQLQKQKQKQIVKEEPEEFIFQVQNRDFGTKGLESLYKRIEMVRMNRLQFDSRNKIKSDVSYSQSTKSRPRGAFDFKGKTFQPSTNLNKTRMY